MDRVVFQGRACGKTQTLADSVDRAMNAIPQRPNAIVVHDPRFRSLALHSDRKSTKMWMRMLRTGNWDRRKMKRMFRLIGEGK